jgi:hypothetical protein
MGATTTRHVAPPAGRRNHRESNNFDLARNMKKGFSSRGSPQNKEVIMSHLEAIASRQRKSRVHDAVFAVVFALAAILSISTVTHAVRSNPAILAHR